MRFSTVFALALGAVPLVSADFNYGVYNCISEGGGYYRSGMIVPAKKDDCSKIWSLRDDDHQIPPTTKYPNATVYGKLIEINLPKLTWKVINGTQHGRCDGVAYGVGRNSTCEPVGNGAICDWNDRVVCHSSLS